MTNDQLTIILASITSILTAMTAMIIAIFNAVSMKRDKDDARRQGLEIEERVKRENEQIAKRVSEKLDIAQRESAKALQEVHDTFNSKMDAAMQDMKDKYYALGVKDAETKAALKDKE